MNRSPTRHADRHAAATAYRCPRCAGATTRDGEAHACGRCGALYPIVCGIPDFRVFPDPYIGLEEDRAKARRMADRAATTDLEGLVRFYFDLTPEVPPALAREYRTTILTAGPARARSVLAAGDADPGAIPANRRAIDLGCGSGTALPALGARSGRVTGTDIALRWLVVARKRLEEAGVDAELVCACAESLPFPDAGFDLALAANVIEHARDAGRLLDEALRVLAAGGRLVATTPNRLTLGPDPHFGVWGRGFLPAPLGERYVRWRRGPVLDQVRTRSYFEIARLLRRTGIEQARFLLPQVTDEDLGRLGTAGRALGRLHNLLRRVPGARALLHLFGPFFQVVAVKG